MAGIVLDGEQRVGLMVALDHYRLAGFDDRQHRIVERAVIDLAFALGGPFRFPVRVFALGEEVLRVGEGRHPAAVLEFGVPAHVIDMQMGAHHEVDRLRRTAAGPQSIEEGRVELVPTWIVPRLVVAEAGVDQDGVPAGLQYPGMDRSDKAVGACLDMNGHHPVLLCVEGLLIELGEHAVGPESGRAQLLDLLDGGSADPANGHGVASLY